MNIRRKSFEAWFLREHGDGNFSRTESGEYADLAVRNYWGIWQGALATLEEQRPAVPEGWRIERTDDGRITVQKKGVVGYAAEENGESIAESALYYLADALLSAQPAEQRPAPAVQGEPASRVVPSRDELIQCLLATHGQSEGITADAILSMLTAARNPQSSS